jgi:hypothetical protein
LPRRTLQRIMESSPSSTMTQTPATRRESLPLLPLTVALLALSAGICVYWFFAARGYWEDDAYIHLEFARSLAAGRGFSFNGHIVYGDTSPLWVWLLVAFHALIPDWIDAGKALTAVAAIFALSGAFVYARTLVHNSLTSKAAYLFAATMVLVFVTLPYFGYWAFSGMEALAPRGSPAGEPRRLLPSPSRPHGSHWPRWPLGWRRCCVRRWPSSPCCWDLSYCSAGRRCPTAA